MEQYESRRIVFKELAEIGDWKIKIYTISKTGEFDHPVFYRNALKELQHWLKLNNSFNSTNYKIAFLILHEASEGIFSIINWWGGNYMLNTNIFLTKEENSSEFEQISGDGLAPCIWELEVINHERLSWINNVLKQVPNHNFEKYISDSVSVEL